MHLGTLSGPGGGLRLRQTRLGVLRLAKPPGAGNSTNARPTKAITVKQRCQNRRECAGVRRRYGVPNNITDYVADVRGRRALGRKRCADIYTTNQTKYRWCSGCSGDGDTEMRGVNRRS